MWKCVIIADGTVECAVCLASTTQQNGSKPYNISQNTLFTGFLTENEQDPTSISDCQGCLATVQPGRPSQNTRSVFYPDNLKSEFPFFSWLVALRVIASSQTISLITRWSSTTAVVSLFSC